MFAILLSLSLMYFYQENLFFPVFMSPLIFFPCMKIGRKKGFLLQLTFELFAFYGLESGRICMFTEGRETE
ncbi:hypothetical protein BDZ91DRAFT_221507 [Kalaharituber pfeilii]|nr:hypothetical protein BDZ91DRAFT_221507 [Kalaharituber pfeilii]